MTRAARITLDTGWSVDLDSYLRDIEHNKGHRLEPEPPRPVLPDRASAEERAVYDVAFAAFSERAARRARKGLSSPT